MNSWNWNGARWWKFDFHTHTPASTGDYGRGPDQEKLMKLTPRDWLLDYMRAGIDCVAITDHNTGEWIDKLKTALDELEREKPDGFRPIHIFPGMEISVNAGIHLLAIFDESATSADMNVLLGLVDYTGNPGKCDDETRKSFEDVVDAIHGRGGIAIPAHVDKENGLFSAEPVRTLKSRLGCQNILAMELIDPAYSKPQIYQEEAPNWTEVVGSDARHPSGKPGQDYPGSRFTWVKMGKPCLEGLKLALLDGPLSVCRSDQSNEDPNTHASCVIESIEVSDARYMGREPAFMVPLNPWLNAVIGGRGTGKSTLVEFLRIALRRTNELPESLTKNFEKYNAVCQAGDGEGLLTPQCKLTVVYRKDDTRYRIQWNQAANATPIEVETKPDDWEREEGDVFQRFPIRIYSQKQIYELAEDPFGLLRIVDESDEVNRREWQGQWQALETRFLSLRAKAREIESGLTEEGSLRGELEDVKRKLTVFEQAGHAQVRKEYHRRIRQQQEVESWQETWSASRPSIRDLARDLAPAPLDGQTFDADDAADASLIRASSALRDQIVKIAQRLETIAQDMDKVVQNWNQEKEQSQWQKALTSAIESYKQLVGKLAEDGVDNPDVYGELVQRKQSIESRLRVFIDRQKEAQSCRGQADTCLEELLEMRRQLTKKREDFLSKVLEGNQYVRIHVLPYQAKDMVEKEFRRVIRREDGGFEKDIGTTESQEGLLGNLYSGKPSATKLENRFSDLKRKVCEIAAEKKEALEALHDRRFASYLAKLPPESLDRLDLWFPEDNLKVKHSKEANGSRFQSIEEGSPGQKTAALLAFLLSYGHEPLILDQPEDDLDNRLIYDLIVTQLRKIKLRRQVIVVTHNANIVVNGDAELVMALKVGGKETRIECSGSMQEKKVRDTICAVMEGGKTAFEQRYRRMTLDDRHV